MPTETLTLSPEEQLVLNEVHHHLNDETITLEQIKTAHGALELERIGLTASMPIPFIAKAYLKDGEINAEKVGKLSSHIQKTRRAVLDVIGDAQKAL